MAQVNPGQQRISSPPPGALNSTATNLPGSTSITATNQTGQTYALGDLTGQLTSLKTAVEQTLPALTAFNSRFANANAGSSRGEELANAISGVLSRALNKNSNQNSSASGTGFTNFTQALNGLITTNSTASSGATNLNPATLSQLRTLQTQLTPVLATLQNLNLRESTNAVPNVQGSGPAYSGGATAPGATPTGR
jgi:hypothetical protein